MKGFLAPTHYHRDGDDCLMAQAGDRTEPDVNAERALLTDYRATLAGDGATVDLSVAEERKHDADPARYTVLVELS